MTGRTSEQKRNEFEAADWLRNAIWYWFSPWRPPHADWDHDHCLFCHVKFAEYDGFLHSGWRTDTPESYDMACSECFEDLRETFRWQTVAAPVGDAGN